MKQIGWVLLIVGLGSIAGSRADEIDDQLRLLGDPDPAIRATAATALVKAGKEALPKLKEALRNKNSDRFVRIAVLQALAIIGPDPEDRELRVSLLVFLKSAPELRLDATRVLGRMGPASADALRNMVKDKDVEVRRFALLGLGYVGPEAKAHVKAIATNLSFKQPPTVRSAAAEALGRIGPDAGAATGDLARAARDKDLGVRVAALIAMCRIVPEEAATLRLVANLINDDAAWRPAVRMIADQGAMAMPFVALRSPDESVRFKALQAMATMKPEDIGADAASALGPALKDESLGIRRAAVSVLNRMATTNIAVVLPRLAEAMKDPDPQIRAQVLAIITRLGGDAKNAAPKLAGLLKEKNPDLRKQILTVLTKVGPDGAAGAGDLVAAAAEDRDLLGEVQKLLDKYGPRALPGYVDALRGGNPAVKILAAEQIGKLGADGREAAAALHILLRDKNKDVRAASADALERIGKGPVPFLRAQLRDKDAATRADAAATLGELGPRAQVTLADLVATVADKDPTVRAAAARALGMMGAPARNSASDLVFALLRDPDPAVRTSAAEALMRVDPDPRIAVHAYRLSLKDPEDQVRRRAAQGLDKLARTKNAFPLLVAARREILLAVEKEKDEDVRRTLAKLLDALQNRAPE